MHCAAHSLNLVVSSLCSVRELRNCIGNLAAVRNFFHTPKRQAVLCKAVKNDQNNDTNRRRKLVQKSATRWVERHDSVIVFCQLYLPVMEALQEVSTWEDKDSSTKALQLSLAIQQSEFIAALLSLNKIYYYSSDLTKALQSKSVSLVDCIELSGNVQEELETIRENGSVIFSEIFKEMQRKASSIETELKKNKTSSKSNSQKQRGMR